MNWAGYLTPRATISCGWVVERDYRKIQAKFEQRSAFEKAYHGYMAQLCWPEGFVGPQCHAKSDWSATRHRWIYRSSGNQAAVTTGTPLEGTRKLLLLWFRTGPRKAMLGGLPVQETADKSVVE